MKVLFIQPLGKNIYCINQGMSEYIFITMIPWYSGYHSRLFFFIRFLPNMPAPTNSVPPGQIFSWAPDLSVFLLKTHCHILTLGNPDLMQSVQTASFYFPNPAPLPIPYFRKLLNQPPAVQVRTEVIFKSSPALPTDTMQVLLFTST